MALIQIDNVVQNELLPLTGRQNKTKKLAAKTCEFICIDQEMPATK